MQTAAAFFQFVHLIAKFAACAADCCPIGLAQ
jgi:hypothetical protein